MKCSRLLRTTQLFLARYGLLDNGVKFFQSTVAVHLIRTNVIVSDLAILPDNDEQWQFGSCHAGITELANSVCVVSQNRIAEIHKRNELLGTEDRGQLRFRILQTLVHTDTQHNDIFGRTIAE